MDGLRCSVYDSFREGGPMMAGEAGEVKGIAAEQA